MPYVRKLPEQYRKENLAVAATFICQDNYQKLKVSLHPALEKADVGGRLVRQRAPDGSDTSVKIEFRNGQLEIRNYELLQLMLASPLFNKPNFGFTIDPTDPTGFWRSIGWVKKSMVPVGEPDFETVDGKSLPAKRELASAIKQFVDNKDEEGNPVDVEVLARGA